MIRQTLDVNSVPVRHVQLVNTSTVANRLSVFTVDSQLIKVILRALL